MLINIFTGRVCWTPSLSLLFYVVEMILQAVRSVPVLSDRSAVNTWIAVLDTAMENNNDFFITLELQAVLKDVETAPKLANTDRLLD